MKKFKRMVASILIIASVSLIGAMPTHAEPPEFKTEVLVNEYGSITNRCYVGDEYFTYRIYDVGVSSFNNICEKQLYITSFSDGYSRKVTIPDELDGVKIKKVLLADYSFINTLILSDGIKTLDFDTDYRSDFDNIYRPGPENPIKKLHLGKSFLADGLQSCVIGSTGTERPGAGALKFLEEITVSEENPNLVVKDCCLFTKDLSTLVLRPASMQWRDDGGYYISSRVTSPYGNPLPDGSLTIGYGAFANTVAKKIILSDEVCAIESSAFINSNVEKLTIPKTVKKIGSYTLMNCRFLKKVTLKCNLKPIIKEFNSRKMNRKSTLFNDSGNVKFYVKNKTAAKTLKKHLGAYAKKNNTVGARIYVGKKLIYKVK